MGGEGGRASSSAAPLIIIEIGEAMTKTQMKQRSGGQNHLTTMLGVTLLILLGFVAGLIVNRTSTPSSPPPQTPLAPLYSQAVLAIASDFICSCGQCGERDLVACTCDTAIREKNYIRDLLNKNYDRETIVTTLETMFGGRKT